MELDRRQLLGGALGLMAAGVAGPASGLFTSARAAEVTRDQVTASSTRFPGDPGSGSLYYGASIMASLSLSDLERQLNGTLTVRRSYFSAGNTGGLISRAREDLAAGRYPLASIKVPGTWASVAAGAYDSWLHSLLSGLATLSKPVMLVLHHEPEDQAGPAGMSPADYVRMQTHAINVASSLAQNVTIVPVLMQWTFDPRSGRPAQDWLVPSSEVFGMDVYNAWYPGGRLAWADFSDKVSMALPYAGGKPVVVAEYGCRTDASRPGAAATWMRDAFAFASQHNIVAMSYFDSNQHSRFGSWVLDGERIAAMRDCLHQSNVARLA